MSEKASDSRHALPVPERSQWQPQHIVVNEYDMVHIPYGPAGLLHMTRHDARDLRDRLNAAQLD